MVCRNIPENVFEALVGPLGLTIGLGMVAKGEAHQDTESQTEGL